MRRRLGLSLPLSLLALAGCSTEPGDDRPPVLTGLPRALSPSEARIVEGANAFAFDLLRQATQALPPDSNVFLSPLSASMALGMTLNGAKGETFDAMRTALRLDGMTEAEINQGYRDLIALVTSLDGRVELGVANSIWADATLPVEPGFTEVGRSFFDAEVSTLDFAGPEALSTINDWVSDKTEGKIPVLLEEIDPDEVLFLVNAIYFKGKWRDRFDPEDTQDGPFHGADGRDRNVRLMWQQGDLRYLGREGFQAVDLLYGNGAFAMTVLLPGDGRTPADVLAELTPERWSDLTAGFSPVEISLILPRFKLEYARRLNGDLVALGMGVAFSDNADFTRLADVSPRRLFLTRVDQKTFVEVDEEGTEAAAATGVGVGVTSASPEMRVDRPFLFAIRERLSGTVVFLGLINVVEP